MTDASEACSTAFNFFALNRVRWQISPELLPELLDGLEGCLGPPIFNRVFQARWAASLQVHDALYMTEPFKYEVSQQGAKRCTSFHLANLFISHAEHWTDATWHRLAADMPLYADAPTRQTEQAGPGGGTGGLRGTIGDVVCAQTTASRKNKVIGECKPRYDRSVAAALATASTVDLVRASSASTTFALRDMLSPIEQGSQDIIRPLLEQVS